MLVLLDPGWRAASPHAELTEAGALGAAKRKSNERLGVAASA
jgi:hypothetical protein